MKKLIGMLVAAAFSAPLLAQPNLDLPAVTANSPGTVEVNWSFTNTAGDDVSGVEYRIRFDGTNFDSISVAECLSGLPAGWDSFSNCIVEDGDTVYMRAAPNNFSDPVPSGPLGSISFNVAAGLAEGDVIDLEIDLVGFTASDASDVAPDQLNDGSIEIVVGPAGILTVTPDPLAFGTIETGTTSTMSATATADAAGGDVNLTSAALTAGAEFTIVGGSCDPFPTLLNPGDSCTIDIEFAPVAEGNFADELCVAGDAGEFECIDVTGAATDGPPPADPVFGINPAPGPVNLGNGDAGDLLTVAGSVTNNGEADLEFNCTIVDDGGGVFSLIPDPFGGTLGEGESDAFELTCALPGGAGEGDSFSGAMECTSNDPTAPTTTHTLACAVGAAPAEPPAVIPTMQTWGLALFALLMLMIGAFSIRTFRS